MQRARRALPSRATRSSAPRSIRSSRPLRRRHAARAVGLHVGDVVAADLRASGPALQRDVARVLERRRGRDADEQHRDADVHEVAAVAAPVAPHERDERHAAPARAPSPAARARRARTPGRPPASTNAAEREHQQRGGPSRVTPAASSTHEHAERRPRAGTTQVAAQVRGRRAPPGDHRPDARTAARARAPAATM